MKTEQIETYHIQSKSAYQIPFYWFCNEGGEVNFILKAALGVPARFYIPLAKALHYHGISVLLLEQRGHGVSGLRAGRGQNFGFKEPLEEEIPLAIEWLEQNTQNKPVYLMGHSLGGHYAAMSSALFPEKISGIIMSACGTPWLEAFEGKTRWQLKLLCFLIPVFEKLLGFYPGDKLGFGGREAANVMRDWLVLAKKNRYTAMGIQYDFELGISQYTGRVLSLRMENDEFAPEKSVKAVIDKFSHAQVEQKVFSQNEIGAKADHFQWAKNPDCIADSVVAWLEK